MKVWVVWETTRDDLDWDDDFTIYETKEKAMEYLKKRNEVLYYNYNVEYWREREPEDTYYREDEFGFEYNDNGGGYSLGLHEMEVL
jgi:hypothetical protein